VKNKAKKKPVRGKAKPIAADTKSLVKNIRMYQLLYQDSGRVPEMVRAHIGPKLAAHAMANRLDEVCRALKKYDSVWRPVTTRWVLEASQKLLRERDGEPYSVKELRATLIRLCPGIKIGERTLRDYAKELELPVTTHGKLANES
jgi:hypothetical protein